MVEIVGKTSTNFFKKNFKGVENRELHRFNEKAVKNLTDGIQTTNKKGLKFAQATDPELSNIILIN